MKFTGFDLFDSTIQRTNSWFKELMTELNWSDHKKTYLAFRCVLHTLRDHLAMKDAVDFGEHLPMLIRGFYFDRWDPDGKPLVFRTRDEFLATLSDCLARDGHGTVNAEVLARAVFRLLDRKVTEGDIEDMRHLFPAVVLELWPPTLRAA